MKALAVSALIVVVGGYLLLRLHRFIVTTWIIVRVWRFLTGEPHHGHAITDAGWFRRGTTVRHSRTGHALRWWHLPRWQRTLHRTGSVVLAVGLLAGLGVAPRLTIAILCALAAAALAVCAWLFVRLWRDREDRNTWLIPGHKSLHELANWPKAKRAASWIELETAKTKHEGDRATSVLKATLRLPDGWPPDAKEREKLIARAATQFGIESPDTTGSRWAGQSPVLVIARSEPPPALVRWEQVADAVAKAHRNELVSGIGKKGQVTTASLSLDSPHFGINMGSGGGKSNLAAFWLMQQLHQGAIAMVLDAKWNSHPWLIKDERGEYDYLPNIAYLSSVEELHAGMVWLGKELDRRMKVARRAVTASGSVRADIGPRLIVVAEELNLAMPKLREYWADIRTSDDPKKSPALTGFGSISFAGRALKIHAWLIGQMVTAEVTGSRDSSVKQSVGVWAMSRYGAAGWRTAVGDVPMPPVPDVPGRMQLVVGRNVHECQPPLIDTVWAREYATAGEVALCPAGMPGAVTGNRSLVLHGGPDQPFVTVSAPPPAAAGGHRVTLKEAVALGIVHRRTSHDSLKMARFRDEDFPEPKDRRGTAMLYDAAELAAWDQARRS